MQKPKVQEVMNEAMLSAVVDVLNTLRNNNVDNAFLRETKAIHGNTTFADLPSTVRASLIHSSNVAIVKLGAAGYSVKDIIK
jgi:hypothetical protein